MPLIFLGKEYDEEELEHIKEDLLLTNKFAKDSRGLVGYKIVNFVKGKKKKQTLFIEEVLAMILEKAKVLSEKGSNTKKVKDVAITIPSSFSISQRRMI